MAYSKNFRKKVIESYRKNLGNVTLTCKKVGIDPSTFYEWIKENEEFAAEINFIKEQERGDFVESALMNRIAQGDTTAIIFACKTICKDRGYVERSEHTGVDGKPLIPSRMTDEEIMAEIARLKKIGDKH